MGSDPRQAHWPPPRAGATMGRWPTVPSVSHLIASAQAGPIWSPGGGGGLTPRTRSAASVPRVLLCLFPALSASAAPSSPAFSLSLPPVFPPLPPPLVFPVLPHAVPAPLSGAAALPSPAPGRGLGCGLESRRCLVCFLGWLLGWRALGQVSPPTLVLLGGACCFVGWAVRGLLAGHTRCGALCITMCYPPARPIPCRHFPCAGSVCSPLPLSLFPGPSLVPRCLALAGSWGSPVFAASLVHQFGTPGRCFLLPFAVCVHLRGRAWQAWTRARCGSGVARHSGAKQCARQRPFFLPPGAFLPPPPRVRVGGPWGGWGVACGPSPLRLARARDGTMRSKAGQTYVWVASRM